MKHFRPSSRLQPASLLTIKQFELTKREISSLISMDRWCKHAVIVCTSNGFAVASLAIAVVAKHKIIPQWLPNKGL